MSKPKAKIVSKAVVVSPAPAPESTALASKSEGKHAVAPEETDLMYTLLCTHDANFLETHLKMLIGFFMQQYPTASGDHTLDYDRWKVGTDKRMYIHFLFLFGLISCQAWRDYVGHRSPYPYFDPLLFRIRTGIEAATLPRTEGGKPTEGHFDLFVLTQRVAYCARIDPYGKAAEYWRNGYKLSDAVSNTVSDAAASAVTKRTT